MIDILEMANTNTDIFTYKHISQHTQLHYDIANIMTLQTFMNTEYNTYTRLHHVTLNT